MPVPEVATAAPHIGIAVDVPGAKELPDPKLIYKVVFDLKCPPPRRRTRSTPAFSPWAASSTPWRNMVCPRIIAKFIVVFHRGSTPAILNNEEYKKRNNGVDNPNIKIMEQLKKAGVEFRVCGQSVLFNHIDPKTIQPIVELDLVGRHHHPQPHRARLCPSRRRRLIAC